jgi:hypothetical protein
MSGIGRSGKEDGPGEEVQINEDRNMNVALVACDGLRLGTARK